VWARSGAFDLVVSCLVDQHPADLRPLYGEVAGLLRAGGRFVLAELALAALHEPVVDDEWVALKPK
jgi:SAM-dependent methyltransferase